MPTQLNIPCCVKGDCDDPSNPFANLTAEGPDADFFIGVYHGSLQQPPPLNWTWGTQGCTSFCTSTISQQDADLCAQRQEWQCSTQEDFLGGGGWNPPSISPVFSNPQVVTNSDQSCTVNCPDGLPFTFTLPAGTIAGINQDYVNQQAMSLACIRAILQAMCLSDLNPDTATVGTPYSATISVTGGVGPYGFVFIGALPPGLSANPSTSGFVTISGTPTTAGTFAFTVSASDSTGLFMNKTYTITVTGACPNFGTLSWGGSYFEGSAGGGTESISPGAVGSSASFSATVDGNVFGGTAACRNDGFLVRKGGACNCNLHLVVSANTGVVSAQVQITDSIGGLMVFQNQGTLPVGTYDFPFTLPDTAGMNSTVDLSIQLQTAAGPTPRSFHFTGVVTNV